MGLTGLEWDLGFGGVGDIAPSPEPGSRRRGSGAMWIAAAILIAAIIVSLTIWATRPKADPQSSQAACEAADGIWVGDTNRLLESEGLPVVSEDCIALEE